MQVLLAPGATALLVTTVLDSHSVSVCLAPGSMHETAADMRQPSPAMHALISPNNLNSIFSTWRIPYVGTA